MFNDDFILVLIIAIPIFIAWFIMWKKDEDDWKNKK